MTHDPHPGGPTPDSPTRDAPVSDTPTLDTPTLDTPTGRAALTRIVVLVPTYNERDNLAGLVTRVLQEAPQVDVCVLDDASPDGTGDVADELAAADDRVHVLHRSGKNGLGAAYLHGFTWALEHGYDAVVELDADGSHRPQDLPRVILAAQHADVVIGSRWVPGGEVVNWPRRRKALSLGANAYTRIWLGMPVRDATAGFRLYRADALRAIDLHEVASQGYCFQVDLTWRAVRAGLVVVEVPITFVEREHGVSKMSGDIVRESMRRIAWWGARYRGHQALEVARAARRRVGPQHDPRTRDAHPDPRAGDARNHDPRAGDARSPDPRNHDARRPL